MLEVAGFGRQQTRIEPREVRAQAAQVQFGRDAWIVLVPGPGHGGLVRRPGLARLLRAALDELDRVPVHAAFAELANLAKEAVRS